MIDFILMVCECLCGSRLKIKTFFCFLFFTLIVSCVQPQSPVSGDFYQGLKSVTASRAITYYERALAGNNVYIRRAAAQELAVLSADGFELSVRTMERVRREIHGTWAAALESVYFRSRNDLNKEKPLAFLLTMDQGVTEKERQYVLRMCEEIPLVFSEQEYAAIEGHYYISKLRYNEALASFRGFREEGEWPRFIPDIFLKHPVLINDLGRAFQYTSSGNEGMALFLEWEKNLLVYESFSALQEARYRLLFFAARIARRIGQFTQAMALFERSLNLAPNAEQEDACIWYILDLALRNNLDVFSEKTEQYVSRWHNKSYYNDILERVLQTLCENRDWDRIASIFEIIKDSGASMKAGYAWITGRVKEEGYKTRTQLGDKNEYFLAAYNAGANDMSSALYYRGLSAGALKKHFFPKHLQAAASSRRSSVQRARARQTAAIQFINGFFTYNASDHALDYIRQMEKDLSFEELRAAASALEDAGMYVQAIRLALRYTNRHDFPGYTRRDLELLFPCPYKDLVDKYSFKTGIAPELLFGLIRTESAFQSAVVSRAGAVGLTQLMPATAEEMAVRLRRAGGPDYSGDNLNMADPEQNIHIGAYYLSYLMGRFENMQISLLAYNGGMNRIRRLWTASTLPPDLFMETLTISETRDYGRKVLGAAEVYKALYY